MKLTFDPAAVCRTLGYTFHNPELLRLAFTHPSYSYDGLTQTANNQRLEFLGDAILGLVIGEELFRRYPQYEEGELSRLRARLVCEEALCLLARSLNYQETLLVDAKALDTRNHDGALADAYEAVIAAIYLDSGLEQARRFILSHHEQLLRDPDGSWLMSDSKSKLQIWAQARKLDIRYETWAVNPSSPMEGFEADVFIGNILRGHGKGHSKKEAQQIAAGAALAVLENENR